MPQALPTLATSSVDASGSGYSGYYASSGTVTVGAALPVASLTPGMGVKTVRLYGRGGTNYSTAFAWDFWLYKGTNDAGELITSGRLPYTGDNGFGGVTDSGLVLLGTYNVASNVYPRTDLTQLYWKATNGGITAALLSEVVKVEFDQTVVPRRARMVA